MEKFNCRHTYEDGVRKDWEGNFRIIERTGRTVEAEILGRGSSFTILVGQSSVGNYLCIPMLSVGCPLADWCDRFWNLEHLIPLMNETDAVTVVFGIEAMMKED